MDTDKIFFKKTNEEEVFETLDYKCTCRWLIWRERKFMMNDPSHALNNFYLFIISVNFKYNDTPNQDSNPALPPPPPIPIPFLNPSCLVLLKLTYLALAIKTVWPPHSSPINEIQSWRSTSKGSFPRQELTCRFKGLVRHQMYRDREK